MQSKSTRDANSFRNTSLILITLIFFILIVFLIWAQTLWIFVMVVFLIAMVFSTMLFWQQYAVPDLGIAEHIVLSINILKNQITRSPLILTIKNGKIEGDYLLLKNKPEIKVLNVDHKSAVLIKDNNNRRSLFLNGVHVFTKDPKIIGVFYIGIRFLHVGPSDRNDLGTNHSSESLAEYHLRKETVERAKTRLISGDFIYPSFSIFYRIAPADEKEMENTLFQGIYEKIGGSDSDPVSIEKVDEFIVFQLLKKWKAYCENKSKDEVMFEFPDLFEIQSLNELGIRSRITLDQIY